MDDAIFLVNRMNPDSKSYLSYHSVNRGGIEADAFDIAVFDDMGNYIYRGGECGGLLFFFDGDQDNRILICNPTSKERKFLPPSKVSDPLLGDVYEGYGFGYAESSQDFKILRFFRRDDDPYECKDDEPMRAEIYSFKTNCWKEIRCPASLDGVDYFSSASVAAHVNGNLYWAATFSECIYNSGKNALLSFNLATECFSYLPLPYPTAGTEGLIEKYMQDMFEFNGKLGAFVYQMRLKDDLDDNLLDSEDESTENTDIDGVIQIWEWKHEGSWVKVFQFMFDDVVKPLRLIHGLLYLEVMTGGEFTQLGVKNVYTHQFVNLEVCAHWGEMEIYPYTLSTFPLPKDLADASEFPREWIDESGDESSGDESVQI